MYVWACVCANASIKYEYKFPFYVSVFSYITCLSLCCFRIYLLIRHFDCCSFGFQLKHYSLISKWANEQLRARQPE